MLRRLYNWTLAKAADPRAAWWLALFAFLEASVFPLPPHPLLAAMCLAEPRKAVRFGAIATLASVAGGLVGYGIGSLLYDTVGQAMIHALGLEASFPKAACYLREHGALAIIGKGVTPIPFKLVTITAGFVGISLLTFIVASLVSRAISFMIVGLLFRLFGAPIKSFIDRYLGLVTIGFVVLVVVGFVAATMLGGHGANDACAMAGATIA